MSQTSTFELEAQNVSVTSSAQSQVTPATGTSETKLQEPNLSEPNITLQAPLQAPPPRELLGVKWVFAGT